MQTVFSCWLKRANCVFTLGGIHKPPRQGMQGGSSTKGGGVKNSQNLSTWFMDATLLLLIYIILILWGLHGFSRKSKTEFLDLEKQINILYPIFSSIAELYLTADMMMWVYVCTCHAVQWAKNGNILPYAHILCSIE